MSTNRKASIAKRARELAQKDRVRDRDQRRADRKARLAERAANGIVGPEMGEPEANEAYEPSVDEAQPLADSPEG